MSNIILGHFHAFSAVCHPTRTVFHDLLVLVLIECSCVSGADWCLQSDVMPDSRLQATLMSFEGSRFQSLLGGDVEPDEDDGSYFIDRDGRHFYLLLKYLRDPENFVMPADPMLKKELVKEAKFYQVRALSSSRGSRHAPAPYISVERPISLSCAISFSISRADALTLPTHSY